MRMLLDFLQLPADGENMAPLCLGISIFLLFFLSPRSLETKQGSVCRKMLNISASDMWKEQEFALGAGSRAPLTAAGGVPAVLGTLCTASTLQEQHLGTKLRSSLAISSCPFVRGTVIN